MSGFTKERYLQKCADFACQPVALVLDLLDSGNFSVVNLNGKHPKLFKNRVSAMQVYALCEALYEEPSLRQLLLPFNFLNDMAVAAVARLLQTNAGLQFVDLRGNEISGQGATALADVLQRPDCQLQGLVLRGNPLGEQGTMALAEMLRKNKSLVLLDVGDTRMGIKGLITTASALAEDNTSLQALDLEDPQIEGGPQVAASASQHLARMLAANASLTDLSLAKQRLVDSQLEELLGNGLLKRSGTGSAASLVALNLRANKLSPLVAPLLERLLSECGRLARLNLANNALGNDGCMALARCLPYCHALRSLDLRANNIGEQGLAALAEALPLAQGLQELYLWGNSFGPGACRALMEALSQPGLSGLRTDIKPYSVDGEVQVALLQEE